MPPLAYGLSLNLGDERGPAAAVSACDLATTAFLVPDARQFDYNQTNGARVEVTFMPLPWTHRIEGAAKREAELQD